MGCPTCNETGFVAITCEVCGGSGEIMTECPECTPQPEEKGEEK